MSRSLRSVVRPAAAAALFIATFSMAGCYAGVGYATPADGVYEPEGLYQDGLPPAFVATAQPYYYAGRPNYWYRNHWHYREGGRWNHYRAEPAPLREYRTQVGGVRIAPHFYERSMRGHR